MGTKEPRRLTLHYGGIPPSRREKGGKSNDYISGFILILHIHCCPYKSDLSDSKGQKKKVAATTTNSDGSPFIKGQKPY